MTKTLTTSFALLAGLALSAQQPPAQPAPAKDVMPEPAVGD